MKSLNVRRLMTVIALIALVLWTGRLLSLRQKYLTKADEFAGLAANVNRTPEDVSYWEARWAGQREGKGARYPWPAKGPFVPAITWYYDAMRKKYERAASRPWLAVEPDPSLNEPASTP